MTLKEFLQKMLPYMSCITHFKEDGMRISTNSLKLYDNLKQFYEEETDYYITVKRMHDTDDYCDKVSKEFALEVNAKLLEIEKWFDSLDEYILFESPVTVSASQRYSSVKPFCGDNQDIIVYLKAMGFPLDFLLSIRVVKNLIQPHLKKVEVLQWPKPVTKVRWEW